MGCRWENDSCVSILEFRHIKVAAILRILEALGVSKGGLTMLINHRDTETRSRGSNRSHVLIRAPLLLCVSVSLWLMAYGQGKGFTVEQILGFPSPDNLVASPTGSTIAWTFNERGVRNIYTATGPSFEARKVTAYT